MRRRPRQANGSPAVRTAEQARKHEWYLKNRDKILAADALRDREREKARANERYARDPEYANKCKSRARAWRQENAQYLKDKRLANRNETIAKKRLRYKQNQQAERKSSLERYYADRERAKERHRRWRLKNIEYVKLRAREHRIRSKEYISAKIRAWNRANKDLKAHYQNARRLKTVANGGSHTIKQWQDLVSQFLFRCAYCGRGDLTLSRDHKIPVSRGGTDDIGNIIPSCRPCNSSKGDMTADEFLGSTRFAARLAAVGKPVADGVGSCGGEQMVVV